MFDGMNEGQARGQILDMVKEYCDKYHNIQKPFKEGQYIPYASRVYDRKRWRILWTARWNSGLHQESIRMNLRKTLQIIWA